MRIVIRTAPQLCFNETTDKDCMYPTLILSMWNMRCHDLLKKILFFFCCGFENFFGSNKIIFLVL